MTKAEFWKINDILDDLDNTERDLCDRHIALNPEDSRRITDAQRYAQAISDVRRSLRAAFKNSLQQA